MIRKDLMDELIGKPSVALACVVCDDVVALLAYPDESWGIRRGGGRATVWESRERGECHRAVCRICEVEESLGLPVVELLAVLGERPANLWVSPNPN